MKLISKHIICALVATTIMTGCGDSFLETPQYDAVDLDTGLNDVSSVNYALNGAYNRLLSYGSAGNYATLLGDYGSDIVYNGGGLGSHLTSIYQFNYSDTESCFNSIWDYSYKVADNSSRVILACEKLLSDENEKDEKNLRMYEAEARCLRAFVSLQLVNVFCHQVKVDGTDYSSMPGIVIIDNPIQAYEKVERSTVGETYSQIIQDLEKAISLFNIAGDRGNLYYFSKKAAYGLLARANLYLENWEAAASAAKSALEAAGITTLVYDSEEYKALYNGGKSNTESMFALAISEIDNNGENSTGNFFSNYGYSISPYLYGLYGEEDCRKTIFGFKNNANWWGMTAIFNGGKFGDFGETPPNPKLATNYLVNAPEMFLIQAEAYAQKSFLDESRQALLVVAKRNKAITSINDLPANKEALMQFIYNERARELVQEGFRLWDLRRWNIPANLFAFRAPEIFYRYNNQHLGDLVFPIPAGEVNAGFGVEQNKDWSESMPVN